MPFSIWGRQGALEECLIRHNLVADQMFLDDPLNNFWGRRFVPDPFGVDQHDRALLADAQTIGLGAEDATGTIGGRFVEAQFLEAAFEVVPGDEAGRFVATDRVRLVGADQDMAIDRRQVELGDSGLKGGIGGVRGYGHGGVVGVGVNHNFITTLYGALTIAAISGGK
jgi:hypothetical protein